MNCVSRWSNRPAPERDDSLGLGTREFPPADGEGEGLVTRAFPERGMGRPLERTSSFPGLSLGQKLLEEAVP